MKEQRRHQRVRFGAPPLVRLGQAGRAGMGHVENLSIGGLMVRTNVPLKVGEPFGCEFSVLGSEMIDVSAVAVGRVGDELYSARFQTGPVSERLLTEEISGALARGKASAFSVNEFQGRRVVRVVGGLNGCLRNDFMYALDKGNVDGIDLAEVKDIDRAGAELCRIASQTYRLNILRPTCPISEEIAAIAGWKS
jgi:hypothetical protein